MNPRTPKSNKTILHSSDLEAARRAISALAPHLPEPRLGEWMTGHGVTLPRYPMLGAPNAPAMLLFPGALIGGLGPYTVRSLPGHWISTHEYQKQRRDRATQMLRLYPICLRAESGYGDVPSISCDGVVAGLLVLMIRPRLGALRKTLIRAAVAHPFGAYLAAHGRLIEEDDADVLDAVAQDSRLASALCRHDPKGTGGLHQHLLAGHDLWAATAVLDDAMAEFWLQRVAAKAIEDPVAAMTALALQPGADEKLKARWLDVLMNNQPSFAYQAARWTKRTWPSAPWLELRQSLKAKATSDLGGTTFHWYRDVEPEKSDEALHNEHLEVLWAVELIHASKSFGQALRRRCVERLNSSPADFEARLALRWLDRRGRPS